MINSKCRICRRAGEKLFLKEEKCYSQKCPVSRKSYPPGASKGGMASKKPKRSMSEYGYQLREKQKLKFLYFLRERQFANYIKKALKAKNKDIASQIAEFLELRLDNAVYRLGFTKSRSIARQLVSHGHFLVNGKKVDIPSFNLKVGDKISIRSQSANKKIFQDMEIYLKKYNPPGWLEFDKQVKIGRIAGKPQAEDLDIKANLNAIIEFYSR